MQIEKLAIDGAWIAYSPIHTDNRGIFREWFRGEEIENALGRTFTVLQSNISISQKGVLRGLHYSLAKGGQAKWITCVSGTIWDVIVDIRPTSPTFKKWVGVSLGSNTGFSIFITEGLAHGFMALEDNSAVSYLLTTPFSQSEEYGVNPFDSELNITWPIDLPILSTKDRDANTLRALLMAGKLPH